MKLLTSLIIIIYFNLYPVFSEDQQKLTPEDEEFLEGGALLNFMQALELQSGLANSVPNYVVYGINCQDFNQCTVNPDGSLIWEVRMQFYSLFMMQAHEDDEEAQKVTIDGCLQFNPTDYTAYNQCMQQVRRNMRISMATSFDSIFRSLIEEDCSGLSEENCYDDNKV